MAHPVRLTAANIVATSLLCLSPAPGAEVTVPPVSPKNSPRVALRMGTDNSQPYHFIRPDGHLDGMIAAVLVEAARRSNIQLQWLVRREGPTKALAAGNVDLWPLVSAQANPERTFHFTRPYLRNSYIAVCSKNAQAADGGVAHLKRVAIIDYPLIRRLAVRAAPEAQLSGKPTRIAALEAVCRGEADAAFMEARSAQVLMLDRPAACAGFQFNSLGLDAPPTHLSIASTLEHAASADRLRDAIDTMLRDGTMQRMLRPWNYYYSGEAELLFRESELFAATREASHMAAGLAVLALLLLAVMWRMRRASRGAREASQAKSRFLAAMSHEIRTPLHGVIGMGELLAATPLQSDQREYVDMLRQSGHTLLELVNDILDLSRVEHGKLELEPAAYAPAALLADLARLHGVAAASKGVQLRTEGLESLPAQAYGDAGRIRQIAGNLLANAVKFTAEGSVTLCVSVERRGPAPLARIAVVDTGIGIAAAHTRRIFEQFTQAEPGIAARFGGTGLGLSIARTLVRLMGGEIGVASAPGQGSTFWFTLPMPPPPGQTHSLPEDKAESREAPGAAEGAPVLLVEDNPINQRIAQRLLERAGLRVTTAADGIEALRHLESERFRAVFMDCLMPRMDGFQTAAEIRRRESGLRRTPVIALTASAMKGERERCLGSGMDDYLAKPIDLVELDRVLRRWVASAPAPDDAAAPRPGQL